MESYEALRSQAAWIDLSARGKIRVLGEDRARLLHAMSTNDVNRLPEHAGLYTFFLTAQGRILADAYLYNAGESLFLDTEPEVGPKLRDHLDKYIIADDVTLEEETAQWITVGIEGPDFLAAADRLSLPIPPQPYSIAEWQQGFVSRVSAIAQDGLRIFLPKAQKDDFLRHLAEARISQADAAAAAIVRLENGKPRYGEDISERYLVQETQQGQAVHTNKGCYLGQEIVERVRSRGQVHRLLTPLHIQSKQTPVPGSKLLLDGKEVGEITSAAYSPALQQVAALAYLRTEALSSSTNMTVATNSGPAPISLLTKP